MITKELQSELRMKYNPDGSNRRKAQLRMVEMLKFLDHFCKENNINYWIDGGTLLGAVRHQGFIPWDDDTDVCMTRKDYVRFTKLFEGKQYGDFVLQTPKTDKGFFKFWNVVRDIKTEYVHSDDMPCEQMLKYKGLQIDIFPITDRYSKLSMKIAKMLEWRVKHYYIKEASTNHHIRTRVLFYLTNNIIYPILRLLIKKKQSIAKFDYGVCFYNSVRYMDDIFPLSRITFEGIELNAPKNPLHYCELIFGDKYMELPKEDLIYDHHTTILFK